MRCCPGASKSHWHMQARVGDMLTYSLPKYFAGWWWTVVIVYIWWLHYRDYPFSKLCHWVPVYPGFISNHFSSAITYAQLFFCQKSTAKISWGTRKKFPASPGPGWDLKMMVPKGVSFKKVPIFWFQPLNFRGVEYSNRNQTPKVDTALKTIFYLIKSRPPEKKATWKTISRCRFSCGPTIVVLPGSWDVQLAWWQFIEACYPYGFSRKQFQKREKNISIACGLVCLPTYP